MLVRFVVVATKTFLGGGGGGGGGGVGGGRRLIYDDKKRHLCVFTRAWRINHHPSFLTVNVVEITTSDLG